MLAGLKNIFSSRGSSVEEVEKTSESRVPDRIVVESSSPAEPTPFLASGRLIEYDLRYIISQLSDQLKGQVDQEISRAVVVKLPAALLSRKIQKGDLSISFGTLKKMSPEGIFGDETNFDHKRVELDIEETQRQLNGESPTRYEDLDLNLPAHQPSPESEESIILDEEPIATVDLQSEPTEAVSINESQGALILSISKIKDCLPDACKAEVSGLPDSFETPLHIPAEVARAFYENADATASWQDFWSWLVPTPPVTGFSYPDPIKIPMELFIPEYMAWNKSSDNNETGEESQEELEAVESLDLSGLELENPSRLSEPVEEVQENPNSRIEVSDDRIRSTETESSISIEEDIFASEIHEESVNSKAEDNFGSIPNEEPDQTLPVSNEESVSEESFQSFPETEEDKEVELDNDPFPEEVELEKAPEFESSDTEDSEVFGVEIGSLPEVGNDTELPESSLGALPGESESMNIVADIPSETNFDTPNDFAEDNEANAQQEESIESFEDFEETSSSESPVESVDASDDVEEITHLEEPEEEVEECIEEPQTEEPEISQPAEVPPPSFVAVKPAPVARVRISRKAHDPAYFEELTRKYDYSHESGNISDEQTIKLARMFFQPQKHLWTTDEIIGKSALLDGVDGIIVSLDDGMIVGSRMDEKVDVSSLGKEIPAVFNSASALWKKEDQEGPECLSLEFHGETVNVFHSHGLYLMAFTKSGVEVPQKQLKFITTYLSRKLG